MLRRLVAHLRLRIRYTRSARKLAADPRTTLVLRYHSVGPSAEVASYVSPGISLEPERFERHVAFLASRYEIVSLDDALTLVERGRPSGGRPAVCLTFDDGYRDNFVHALPSLIRHRAPAAIYVVAGSVDPDPVVWTVRVRQWVLRHADADGRLEVPAQVRDAPSPRMDGRELNRWLRGLPRERRDRIVETFDARFGGSGLGPVMMNECELRSCVSGGVAIGAHTISHPLLTALPAEEARHEIVESRRMLESKLGCPVIHFSYPNPGGGLHENDVVRALVSQAGFHSATTSQPGLCVPGVDPFRIGRFGVNAGWQERLLLRCLGEPTPSG